MKPASPIIAGCVVAAVAAGSCFAEAPKPQPMAAPAAKLSQEKTPQGKSPYEIVRSLESLHDQMVLGNKGAQTAMPNLLRQLGARLVEADPNVWRDPRNARSIVVYILSGGEIRVARKVLNSGKCSPLEQRLIEGALEYLEGDKVQAKSLLENVDPRTLEADVGGHVALAQAALIADNVPRKAMALLDMARVLVPGTLVEDAALRREVFLAAELGDYDKFLAMAAQYLRRFSQSVYAENFHRSLAVAVARLSQGGTQQQLSDLADLLKGLDAHEQLRLYLHVAQSGLLEGKVSSAKWAASHAVALAPKNSADSHRALLYDGAASILTTDYDHGLGALKGLDATLLPRDERVLKEVALDLATQIRKWPQPPLQKADNQMLLGGPPTVSAQPPATPTLAGPLADAVKSSDATLAQAQQLLTDSDALLEGETP